MKKILVLGQMKDLQTGMYIVQSIEELGYEAGFVDIRAITEDEGLLKGQQIILDKIDELKFDADMVIVLKGLEITLDTLKKIKEKFTKATFINWFFDVFLAGKEIWKNTDYYDVINFYDFFICSLKGVADKLKENGFKNAIYVGEGCYPLLHSEQYMNNFQVGKYGEDVAFIGSVGMVGIHKNRVQYLSKVIKEGFNLKIWGKIIGEAKSIPMEVKKKMMNTPVINDQHSYVCQSSLVNLGIDQDPSLDDSWSARLYRVMCAGGLYLSVATKGLDNHFKINKKGEEITPDQELVVFYDEDDLVNKLDFLLEHDEIRESIAKNGQKVVKEKHKFSDRLKKIIKKVEGE